MEINTHESEVFVSANDTHPATVPVCTAMGIGTLLFGAGYMVGKLIGKPKPASVHYHHHYIAHDMDDLGCDDDFGDSIENANDSEKCHIEG